MIIYLNTLCCKCGDAAPAYGYDSEGDICRACSPYWDCRECHRTLPVDRFDGPDDPTCTDCAIEVEARRAVALGVATGDEVTW